MKGGNFYTFDVFDQDGKLFTSFIAKMYFL